MSSSRSGDHHHHHHHDEHSKRHRLAKIAGQLGAGLIPGYNRPSTSTTTTTTRAGGPDGGASVPPKPSHHGGSSSSSASDRLLAISQQLGGAVGSDWASRQNRHHSASSSSSASSSPSSMSSPHPSAMTKSHLVPHEEAKQWERLPKYRDLPSEGGFHGCAWDVWGRGDQLGTLNLLTDHVRARSAREEIRTGHCISLSWPLHLPMEAAFGRQKLVHTHRPKSGKNYLERRAAVIHERRVAGEPVEDRSEKDNPEAAPLSDDEIHLNTQAGSQWDGFSHFGHLSLNTFYQGHTRKEIHDGFATMSRPVDPRGDAGPSLGVQAWAQRGIAGRGVLLDVWGYLTRNNGGHSPYDPAKTHAITLEDLRGCARAQGVRFRQGDILLVRTGWTTRYYHSTDEERQVGATGKNGYVGLEQGDAMLEWLWDHHFSAVASDAPALERWPCPLGSTHLHETLLALWGMPIGEMFDLEALTEHCQRARRWTFYFSSWPLNLWGGVASTANAGATF